MASEDKTPSSDTLCFSRSPGYRADGPSLARHRSAGIHARCPLRSLRCSAPCNGGGQSHINGNGVVPLWLLTLLLPLLLTFGPLLDAEHRSDLWGQTAWMPAERGQAMDGLSARYPRDREKRRESDRASASRDPTACRGPAFFAYFLCVKESEARDSAKNQHRSQPQKAARPALLLMQCRQRIADLRRAAALDSGFRRDDSYRGNTAAIQQAAPSG